MNMFYLTGLALAFLLVGIVDAGSWPPNPWVSEKTIVLDNQLVLDMESIAKIVCKNKKTNQQISQPLTIGMLSKSLSHLKPDHPLYDCNTLYEDSWNELLMLMAIENQDACSYKKIDLLERYHKRYVSKLRKDEEERKIYGWFAPEIIKFFFMHYASHISSICERSFSNDPKNHAELATTNDILQDPAGAAEIPLSKFAKRLALDDLSNGYDSLYLPWKLIDELPISNDDDINRYMLTGSSKKLALSLNGAEKLISFQKICRETIRPNYRSSLLSVLRLVEMGYYPSGTNLISLLRNNDSVRRHYLVLQICELILPIYFVEDGKLSKEQVVVLTKEQANIMLEKMDKEEESVEPALNHANSIENLKVLDSVIESDGQKVIKRMRAVIESRGRALMRLFSLLMRNMMESKNELNLVKLSFEDRHTEQLLDRKLAEASDRSNEAFMYSQEDDISWPKKVRSVILFPFTAILYAFVRITTSTFNFVRDLAALILWLHFGSAGR